MEISINHNHFQPWNRTVLICQNIHKSEMHRANFYQEYQ